MTIKARIREARSINYNDYQLENVDPKITKEEAQHLFSEDFKLKKLDVAAWFIISPKHLKN